MSSRQPSRIVLYDKYCNVLHDADTPAKVQAVNRMLSGQCINCGHPEHVQHCMERVAVMDGLATIGSRLCTCPDPQRVGR